MQYRPTKYCLLLVCTLALAACSNKPNKPVLSPFSKVNLALEQRAQLLYQQGDYTGAYTLYQKAYIRQASLDKHNEMARLLSNQLQIALLLEQTKQAQALHTQLEQVVSRGGLTQYQQRLGLLKANLAIIEQQWAKAETLLNTLNTTTNSAEIKATTLVNLAVVAQAQNRNTQIAIQNAKPYATSLALKARLLRLEAQYAITQQQIAQAKQLISQAKLHYQTIDFAPGIAECLMLEADIATYEQKAALATQLQQQAKTIWLAINNQRAISRNKL